MRTPSHWENRSLLARCLLPFGFLYGAITAWRMRRTGWRAPLPVICVGNLTAGGAGKTPVALALCRLLAEQGERPFVLSRGYGGQLAGPLRVDPDRQTARDCGDEPLMMARHVPVIVARDRIAGALLAEKEGASVIVMDDGLQNPTLGKDWRLAVVDGGYGVGNGWCIPAGPLRAPLAAQWREVDAVVLLGGGHFSADGKMLSVPPAIPVLSAEIMPDEGDVRRLNGRPLMAFAGIGRPQKFFDSLRVKGLRVVRTKAFPDHYAFSTDDCRDLSDTAKTRDLTLVTTEKDQTRWPSDGPAIEVMRIAAVFQEFERVASLLAAAIRRRRSAP